jgi:hypothetical protein
MNKLIKLYNEDNIKIWGDYLTHVDIKFNKFKPKIQNDSKYYAVIIEPRQHINLTLAMKSIAVGKPPPERATRGCPASFPKCRPAIPARST